MIELRSLAELTSVTTTVPAPLIIRLSIKSALAVNTTLLLIVTVGLIPLVLSKCPVNVMVSSTRTVNKLSVCISMPLRSVVDSNLVINRLLPFRPEISFAVMVLPIVFTLISPLNVYVLLALNIVLLLNVIKIESLFKAVIIVSAPGNVPVNVILSIKSTILVPLVAIPDKLASSFADISVTITPPLPVTCKVFNCPAVAVKIASVSTST